VKGGWQVNEKKRDAQDQDTQESAPIDVQGHSIGDDEEDQGVYIETPSTG
jgi:hypothetical protein